MDCHGVKANFKQISDPLNAGNNLSEIINLKTTNDRILVNTVKFFVDGVISDKTALISNKYCNCNSTVLDHFTFDEINSHASLLHEKGIRCHIHVVGDRVLTMAVDAIEFAKLKIHTLGDHLIAEDDYSTCVKFRFIFQNRFTIL
jgi:predicted amidohydrolase YtcJ